MIYTIILKPSTSIVSVRTYGRLPWLCHQLTTGQRRRADQLYLSEIMTLLIWFHQSHYRNLKPQPPPSPHSPQSAPTSRPL